MIFEAEHRKRISKLYGNLTARARPRLWKSAKKKGQVRIPGLASLPFTRAKLWTHVTAQVPDGGALCPYCSDYGRSTLIYLDTFVLDHHVPVKHGGLDCWRLDNLVCVCADCNTIKGSMTYTAFIVLMRDFLPHFDILDRKYITACLRTHGQVMRGFGAPKKNSSPALQGLPLQRTLEEEF